MPGVGNSREKGKARLKWCTTTLLLLYQSESCVGCPGYQYTVQIPAGAFKPYDSSCQHRVLCKGVPFGRLLVRSRRPCGTDSVLGLRSWEATGKADCCCVSFFVHHVINKGSSRVGLGHHGVGEISISLNTHLSMLDAGPGIVFWRERNIYELLLGWASRGHHISRVQAFTETSDFRHRQYLVYVYMDPSFCDKRVGYDRHMDDGSRRRNKKETLMGAGEGARGGGGRPSTGGGGGGGKGVRPKLPVFLSSFYVVLASA